MENDDKLIQYGVEERMNILGQLKEMIAKQGVMQKDIAAQLGIDPAVMTRVLQGRNSPSIDIVARVSQLLGARVRIVTKAEEEVIEALSQRKCINCKLCEEINGKLTCKMRDDKSRYVNEDMCCSLFVNKE